MLVALLLGTALWGGTALGWTPDANSVPSKGQHTSQDFSPEILRGKWLGRWQAESEGKGSITGFVNRSTGNRMYIAVAVNGDPFGCGRSHIQFAISLPRLVSAAPSHPPVVTRKAGWGSGGFAFSKVSPDFGHFTVIYEFATRFFSAKGSGPGCGTVSAYTISGHLSRSSFKASLIADSGARIAIELSKQTGKK